ncbi:hypothetical protein [Streptomyces bauhiniae]
MIDNGDHEGATTLLTRCHADYTRVFGPPLTRTTAERLSWLRDNSA